MATEPPAAPANPFVGPRAFRPGEGRYFFGRARETRELANLLTSQRVVLLHAPSGAGKTSLIQAALMAALGARFEVLPSVRLSRPVAGGPANRFLAAALMSLAPAADPAALAGQTLDGYLTGRPPAAAAMPDGTAGIKPQLLIFDQFEEFLTLEPNDLKAKAAFAAEVGAALARDRDAPGPRRTRWALFALRDEYVAALEPYARLLPTGFGAPYRLDLLGPEAAAEAIRRPFLDQQFTFARDATGQDAADHLVTNLRTIHGPAPAGGGDATATPGPYVEPVQLQVVCFRLWDALVKEGRRTVTAEDVQRLGNVDTALADYYAAKVAEAAVACGVPEMILRTWFEERAITAQGHRAMVPLVDQRAGDLPAAAVQALLDAFLIRRDQRGEFAWLELTHDRLVEPIRGDNRRWFTDSRPVLATYYAAKVAEAAQASGVAEVRLRTWFGERAITEGGHRAKVQAGVDGPEELPEAAVPALLAAYLIRQDQRAEARWLELPDSRLIDPIRRDNQRWFTENLHPFQFQATQWKRRGDERKEKLLLKGPALDDAQVWARRHPDRLRPVDQEFLDASKAGLGAKDYVKLLVYQWLAIIGLGVAATGLALAWVAFHQAQQAERAAQEAKAAQQAADLQRGEAVKAQGQAEAARRQAEADRAEALRQRRQAEARLAELQTALDRQADLYSRLISQYSARASTLATASNQTALRAAGEAWKHLYSTRAPKGFALTDNQDPLEELAAYLDKTKSDAALNPTIQERLTLDLAREFGQPLRDTSSPGQAYVLKNLRRRYYADAKRVTGALAGAANLDAPEAHRNQTRFWELYFGEMAVVEGKAVEAAMIHFGKALKAKDPAQLKQFAAEVAEACDAELAQPVNLP